MVYGKTLREIIKTLQFTLQFNRNLKQEDCKDMDQVLQLHQLLKDIFQWSMDNKTLNLASHWEELGESLQKLCLKEIPYKDLMVITRGWNPNRKFKLLEERATRIRKNQATIQAIEKQLNKTNPTMMPSGSQGVDQPNSPVVSHHSGTRRSVAKSHHYSQSQVVSRRRQGYKGEKKDLFQPQAERVRSDYAEAFGFGERGTQEPEIVSNASRISSPTKRNITPTQNEHSVVASESNLKSDQLWSQMSQFSVKNQEKFDEIHRRNLRLQ
ncbi:hypothetical protein O181_036649 [Austropuccinia psidii MF-1]|uniref:Uncharacterized protein n=1 Tax=Austropuccinia psidii MF-1 TaxID=1389203 RepID=A0A9Q3D525_9BASI|nr:hypothetical protein [Austropuccinia psidii MF-1]